VSVAPQPGSIARGEGSTGVHAITLSGIAFLLVGVGFGLAMILANNRFYEVEGGVAQAASLLPFGYAFAAGMVASVNPCGVLLLPSLVAFYLGQTGAARSSALDRAGRALLLGVTATVGFVAIFAVVGTIFALGGHALGNAFPIAGLLVGIILAGLGGWLALTGRELGLLAASQSMGRVRLTGDARSMFTFGVAYAIASLACTLPVFLVVVGSALATRGTAGAALQFVSYALGMGCVLTVVVVSAALFQGFVARSIRRIVPYVHRVSASFLIGAGIFLVKYWLASGAIGG
jgi:cytochrome c biogenesis protein CcdA